MRVAVEGRGFRFEDTHITEPERFQKLAAVLAMAFAWAGFYPGGPVYGEVLPGTVPPIFAPIASEPAATEARVVVFVSNKLSCTEAR